MNLKRITWLPILVFSALILFLLPHAARGDDEKLNKQLKKLREMQKEKQIPELQKADPSKKVETKAQIKKDINRRKKRVNNLKTKMEEERDALQKKKRRSEDEDEKLQQLNSQIDTLETSLKRLAKEENQRLENSKTFGGHHRAILDFLGRYKDCKGARDLIKKRHYEWVQTYLITQCRK